MNIPGRRYWPRNGRGKPEGFGVDLSHCRELARVGAGVREAMSELYRQLGWDQLLGARRHSGHQILKELVLGRLSQPLSKRAHGARSEGTRRGTAESRLCLPDDGPDR